MLWADVLHNIKHSPMHMRSLHKVKAQGPGVAGKLTTAPVRSCGLGAEVHSAFRLQRSKTENYLASAAMIHGKTISGLAL